MRCGICGRATTTLVPREFQGQIVHLCSECVASRTATLSPSSNQSCGACGGALDAGDAFCGRCGTRVPPRCPVCGAIAEPDDRFCGTCGTDLGTSPWNPP